MNQTREVQKSQDQDHHGRDGQMQQHLSHYSLKEKTPRVCIRNK